MMESHKKSTLATRFKKYRATLRRQRYKITISQQPLTNQTIQFSYCVCKSVQIVIVAYTLTIWMSMLQQYVNVLNEMQMHKS